MLSVAAKVDRHFIMIHEARQGPCQVDLNLQCRFLSREMLAIAIYMLQRNETVLWLAVVNVHSAMWCA